MRDYVDDDEYDDEFFPEQNEPVAERPKTQSRKVPAKRRQTRNTTVDDNFDDEFDDMPPARPQTQTRNTSRKRQAAGKRAAPREYEEVRPRGRPKRQPEQYDEQYEEPVKQQKRRPQPKPNSTLSRKEAAVIVMGWVTKTRLLSLLGIVATVICFAGIFSPGTLQLVMPVIASILIGVPSFMLFILSSAEANRLEKLYGINNRVGRWMRENARRN